MNAPVRIPDSILTPAGLLQRAIDLMVRLWREGRSVAGIQMELHNELDLRCSPRRILQRIRNRRRDDPTIPRALYSADDYVIAAENGEPIDILDQRADLSAAWWARRFNMDEALFAEFQALASAKEA